MMTGMFPPHRVGGNLSGLVKNKGGETVGTSVLLVATLTLGLASVTSGGESEEFQSNIWIIMVCLLLV